MGKKEFNCEMLSVPYGTLSQSLIIRDDVVRGRGEEVKE